MQTTINELKNSFDYARLWCKTAIRFSNKPNEKFIALGLHYSINEMNDGDCMTQQLYADEMELG